MHLHKGTLKNSLNPTVKFVVSFHILSSHAEAYPAGIYLLKFNNRDTRIRSATCSKLTIKIPKRRHWRGFGVFIVNSEHISDLILVFLLLTFNM